ncbi:MAG: hypothetical protein KDD73_08460 [Anaerolineales bacterium]|nr:hypothetical protein [Anaerolineales bacterium]MCB9126464.1 hypothetical protein [Ardenticatenales bacterium]MCB9171624.1 hypothetical protein [Ardenticatenales bacterium]
MWEWLIRLVKEVVKSVTRQLKVEKFDLRELILVPMRLEVVTIESGEIWRGTGADAFVNEVQTVIIPELEAIIGLVDQKGKHIDDATGIIDEADQEVRRLVEGLAELFSEIY